MSEKLYSTQIKTWRRRLQQVPKAGQMVAGGVGCQLPAGRQPRPSDSLLVSPHQCSDVVCDSGGFPFYL